MNSPYTAFDTTQLEDVPLNTSAAYSPDYSSLTVNDIIARFGRFPHRNACLGRQTTAEEMAFLEAGGFAG